MLAYQVVKSQDGTHGLFTLETASPTPWRKIEERLAQRFPQERFEVVLEANYFSVLRGIEHKPDYLAAVERLNRNEISPDHLFDLFKDADERILH